MRGKFNGDYWRLKRAHIFKSKTLQFYDKNESTLKALFCRQIFPEEHSDQCCGWAGSHQLHHNVL